MISKTRKSTSHVLSQKGINDDLKQDGIGFQMPASNVFGLPSSRKNPKKSSFVSSKSYKDVQPKIFTGRKSTVALESNPPFDKSDGGEEQEFKIKSLVTLPYENVERETESALTQNAKDEKGIFHTRAKTVVSSRRIDALALPKKYERPPEVVKKEDFKPKLASKTSKVFRKRAESLH